MKKLILSFCLCLATALGAQAQKLGDYMVIDGVPSFVFYVDETGEHGLAMSVPAVSKSVTSKDINTFLKHAERYSGMKKDKWQEGEYDGLVEWYQNESSRFDKGSYSQALKENENFKEELFTELVPRLGEEGEANATAIKEYCEEKNISMQEMFPWEYWASQLGEGWFIPGDKEIQLYATYYCGGLNKENSMGGVHFVNKRPKELSDSAIPRYIMFDIAYWGQISSTAKHANCGFRKLVRMEKSKPTPKYWFELLDKVTYGNGSDSNRELSVCTCAVHKF